MIPDAAAAQKNLSSIRALTVFAVAALRASVTDEQRRSSSARVLPERRGRSSPNVKVIRSR
jgi:hypothetical protein